MTVVTFSEARRIVEEQARPLRPGARECLPLLDARGRVLAEALTADRDLPPFHRATRDGYAVRAADLATLPVRLEVAGEIKAGAPPETVSCPLASGEAAAIMTGAPVPPGADAVVMVEYTTRHNDVVEIRHGVAAGENVVARGAEARAGDTLVPAGTSVDHAVMAVAASVGKSQVQVYARPRVAVLTTGDEVVGIDAVPGPTQIRNSNSYSLAAQLAAAGAEPLVLPIAPDEPDELRRLIADGLTADLLLITGGVSIGKYDLVEDALRTFHAEFFFTGAQIQPGRPIVFGRAARDSQLATRSSQLFFGLPGNPLSTMLTFELFVRPVVNALRGAAPEPLVFLKARLQSDVRTKTGLTRFLPARITGEFEQAEVDLVRWQGSGDIVSAARANCYLVVPPDRELLPAGELVSVLMKN